MKSYDSSLKHFCHILNFLCINNNFFLFKNHLKIVMETNPLMSLMPKGQELMAKIFLQMVVWEVEAMEDIPWKNI